MVSRDYVSTSQVLVWGTLLTFSGSVFTTAAFSFAGTELVGLAAAESENPRKTLPKAVKQVFWRICLVRIQKFISIH